MHKPSLLQRALPAAATMAEATFAEEVGALRRKQFKHAMGRLGGAGTVLLTNYPFSSR